ncbi:transcriptional regulator [Paenibacillus sp. VTT E-133280]|jgi:Lrp/AsnC family leucine-responsive transcriptional regulator|uniref:Lrp/AsnC family transcriptional regulator n=1 Tax=Paenibacillus TaxID=44249 RepID=UPI000BA05BC3|nr:MULTISPECIES: Lrp/AsnC family transcriptional regulator [unclassified Paenibacillus]MDH6374494.1 Lrp/AsnC family leucine-responsive transcriptional regulator [Paenibacillus sp. PastF-3]OZQ67124.1 transcriptional regulator [Paenibacillus sp. VTT E-133280]OZQ90244.1 transcriptional regulator [Paenibacillus sp. VTT E-133291]
MTKGLIFIFDHIDFAILALLKENSRIQWKDIGQKIHMTGQAVGNRIRRLEDLGVIEQYTIVTNKAKLGLSITAFITFFVESANHPLFQKFVMAEDAITEVHRISGEGCYVLTGHFASNEELEAFLAQLLKHGNYRVNLSIGKIKS